MADLKETKIKLLRHPTEDDWLEAKRRCLVTVGKDVKNPPTEEWKIKLLKANHSPIRYLMFSFYIENIPSWVATHLVRHIHAQPYIKSQRNDRQTGYDRGKAPQDQPIDMCYFVNAEELITIAHKRLCNQASRETRELVQMMCDEVVKVNPEFKELLVPLCAYRNGLCTEFYPCGKNKLYLPK